MPYQCLNQRFEHKRDWFPDPEKGQPLACPECGALKVEWFAPRVNIRHEATDRADASFRSLSDQFGLSDMGQRGGTHEGEMAKRAAMQKDSQGTFGKMNIAGVEVPVEATATAAWGKSSYTPFKVGTKGRFPGRKNIPTQVVARHEGK